MRFQIALLVGVALCSAGCSKDNGGVAAGQESQTGVAPAQAPDTQQAPRPVVLNPTQLHPVAVTQVPGGAQPAITVQTGATTPQPAATVNAGATPPAVQTAVATAGGTVTGRGLPPPPGGRPKPGTK